MNFTKIDRHHVKSECGLYVINKATVGRDRTQCYMAVHRGHTILGTWRCADEPGGLVTYTWSDGRHLHAVTAALPRERLRPVALGSIQ